jgi:predicted nucleotidyltransferase
MEIEIKETIDNKPVTEELVSSLYQFRARLWEMPESDYSQLIEEEDLVGELKTKKDILTAWLNKYLPNNQSKLERFQAMSEEIVRLRHGLENIGANSAFMVFGSMAKGVINSEYSDLDILAAISPKKEEYDKLSSFLHNNFIIASSVAPVEDLRPLMAKSDGLARLYTMTKEGIETEFHFLGEENVIKMHQLKPGKVERVRPVNSKKERLSNFTGGSAYFDKPEDCVYHYCHNNNGYFRGFFPEVMLFGQIIYDPEKKLSRAMQDIWLANTKAFLYHNGYLNRNGCFTIDSSMFTFENFLNTCLPESEQCFSEEAYREIENRFRDSLSLLVSKPGFSPA